MEKNKHFFNSIILIAIILISSSVAYYFLYSLPNYNNEKLKLSREKQEDDMRVAKEQSIINQKKQEEEKNVKASELAKNIQDDCVESVKKSVVSYFDKTNTSDSPLFYPYEDEESFNRNDRLLTALGAYQDCLKNDPRNDGINIAIDSILFDAESASRTINNFMVSYRDKTPGLCDSFLLSDSAKSKCSDLVIIKYNF
jgi:predicted Holliday junction resolvase-like endonuclease